MKKFSLLIFFIGIVIIVAIFTNPKKENHIDKIFLQIIDKEKLANSNPLEAMLIPVAKSLINEQIDYKNYVLFSLSEINEKKLCLGIFGNVFLLFNKNEIDNLCLFPKNNESKNIKKQEETKRIYRGMDIYNIKIPIKKKTEENNKNDSVKNIILQNFKNNDGFKNPYKTDISNNIKFKTTKNLQEVSTILTEKYDFEITFTDNGLFGHSNKDNCIAVTANKKHNEIIVEYTWECD